MNTPTTPANSLASLLRHEPLPQSLQISGIKEQLDRLSDDLMASLPAARQLSAAGRRGIVARYSAVLEGNFIYWMTGAYLAVKTDEARAIIIENLTEEVRDSHPLMLRKFIMAANACPKDSDALAVHPSLTRVRLFIGRLSAAPIVAMMAFFEGFIQKFMPYLAELAALEGSVEMEYTDVHGVCDIAHSQELYKALAAETALDPRDRESLFEGVYLLQQLLQDIICSHPAAVV
jgi:hypothetical protein